MFARAALTAALLAAASARGQAVVRQNVPEKGTRFKAAAVKVRVWSDKPYAISILPRSLRGTQLLVRPAGQQRDWVDRREFTAAADCTAYMAVLAEYNGALQFPESKAKQLLAAGWAEADELFRTTVPKGENWKWRVFRKDVAKGKLDVRVEGLKLEVPTLFFFGPRRKK